MTATEILLASGGEAIQDAAKALQLGELIVFPTDTVYGLGGLVHSWDAVDRLYAVKGRNATKAIPVLIGEMADCALVVSEMTPVAQRLAELFWPGPLTLVVAKHPELPENLSPYATVGVRMPDHPVALNLLRRAGPMAVSSANLSGQPSACSAIEARVQLEGRIRLILDGGRTPGGAPSTVVDCTSRKPVILRAGPLAEDDLLKVIADL